MLTVLTPTGMRPEAFAICERLMFKQNYPGRVNWIVVDDGQVPTRFTCLRPNWERHVVRRKPFWEAGQNTQQANLQAGIVRYRQLGHKTPIVFVEDDDWYHPNWLSKCAEELKYAPLVGEKRARYYQILYAGYNQFENNRHACLRASAIRGSAIDYFENLIRTYHKYYDMKMWAEFRPWHLFQGNLTLGIKGLPGRAGITDWHRLRGDRMDPCDKVLREWVGEDFPMYERYAKKMTIADGRIQMVALKKVKYPRGSRFYHEKDDIFLVTPRDAKVLVLTKTAEALHPEKHKHLIKAKTQPKPVERKSAPAPKAKVTPSKSKIVFDSNKPTPPTVAERKSIKSTLKGAKKKTLATAEKSKDD